MRSTEQNISTHFATCLFSGVTEVTGVNDLSRLARTSAERISNVNATRRRGVPRHPKGARPTDFSPRLSNFEIVNLFLLVRENRAGSVVRGARPGYTMIGNRQRHILSTRPSPTPTLTLTLTLTLALAARKYCKHLNGSVLLSRVRIGFGFWFGVTSDSNIL